MCILRDTGVVVVSGFHSPIEKDCLEILLKGTQPIVVCPARCIKNMRIPNTWKESIDNGRLLVLSPFDEKQKRPTVSTAQLRNHLVAKLGRSFLIPYADAGSKTDQLGREIINADKMVYTFNSERSSGLIQFGAKVIEPEFEDIERLADELDAPD